jgi:hypothetical protein
MAEPIPAPAQELNLPNATAQAERRVVVRAPCGPETSARARGAGGELCCAGQVLDASPRRLGLLLPQPFDVGAVVLVELNCAGLRYGLVAVARVTRAAARPDGYLVGCSLLSPLPGELLRLLPDRVPG